MQPERIIELLSPFLPVAPLSPLQLEQVSNHLDLLLKWNARINLTSVRKSEEIITRHFGESFFLAQTLFPSTSSLASDSSAIDLGSGAGFPALPLKIWAPGLHLTLIESQIKKTTFLKEVIRINRLMDINVFSGRAEIYVGARADLVTMRAVERFERSLPVAAGLLAPGGTLAVLIGASQRTQAESISPTLVWDDPIPLPQSRSRILLMSGRT